MGHGVGEVGLAMGVALAAVLAVSGAAKLLDRAGTREAVAGFGVPTGLVAPVAAVLAPAELVTALLLVLPPTRSAGLVLAALLLLAFTVVVVLALRAGRRPECHCFGRIGGADVSGRTVVRNLVLLAVAAVGIAGVSASDDVDGGRLAGAVVAGLVLAAAVLAAEGVAGARARARRAVDDEAAFEQVVERVAVPGFELEALSGGRTSLDDLLAPGLPVLLVTLSPGCGPCKRLRPDVARWAELFAAKVTVVALATGTREANLASYAEYPALTVLVDEPGTVREALGVSGTPSAVVVGPDGRTDSRVASGEPLVRRLLVATVTGTDADLGAADLDTDGDGVPAAELDLDAVVTAPGDGPAARAGGVPGAARPGDRRDRRPGPDRLGGVVGARRHRPAAARSSTTSRTSTVPPSRWSARTCCASCARSARPACSRACWRGPHQRTTRSRSAPR